MHPLCGLRVRVGGGERTLSTSEYLYYACVCVCMCMCRVCVCMQCRCLFLHPHLRGPDTNHHFCTGFQPIAVLINCQSSTQ